MRRETSLWVAFLYCLITAFVVVPMGCDDDDSSGLRIVPDAAPLQPGQSLRLEAVGGNGDYSWSLSNDSLGSLSSSSGESVVYKSRYRESRESALQIVTVASFVEDVQGAVVSLVPAYAEAEITHVQDLPDTALPVSTTTTTTTTTSTTTSTGAVSSTTSTTIETGPPTPGG